MSWEQVGGRRYYYRHVRVGGESRRVYVGTGAAAEMAAAADVARRLGRAVAARQCQAERDRHGEAEAPLLELCELADTLARAALVAGSKTLTAPAVSRRGRPSCAASTPCSLRAWARRASPSCCTRRGPRPWVG